MSVIACSAPNGDEPPDHEYGPFSPAPRLAADGGPPHGLFEVTAPDGQVYRENVREDGTFSSTSFDGEVVHGTWEMRGEGVFCSKPSGAPDHVWRCKDEVVTQDGVWTSTEMDGGEVSTVLRLESGSAP